MSDYDELCLWLITHHEAAHTVLCLRFDIPVDQVMIDYSLFGTLQGGHVRVPDHEINANEYAIMCRAGQAAEEKWLETHPGNGGFHMANAATDISFSTQLLRKEGSISPGAALNRARTLVTANWIRIGSLADELYRRKRLSERQARRAARV